ncbi:rhoptry kinase family protein ROP36 (incomplete catalytic triad) [Toxoplasma gondii GAB2-2007-GAL-DOM2]|uniref:Rhoptry kinase family protein ROP36 (Incomplete catalytic triad) n=2 Tax=Toxoplasma gondii TaxID=5811 RepID=A0A086KXJ1_TOXGO|nr:rhoptry kinase family protein ROP36 (incomplete catalytic triad) [Toxoplasma gondii GAB2-2007-GAL-DOM2]KFG49109.1 rhoptry kinase family protein ROP36 (incomplete catalytic triad) [Toxoplasma gondii FOU]
MYQLLRIRSLVIFVSILVLQTVTVAALDDGAESLDPQPTAGEGAKELGNRTTSRRKDAVALKTDGTLSEAEAKRPVEERSPQSTYDFSSAASAFQKWADGMTPKKKEPDNLLVVKGDRKPKAPRIAEDNGTDDIAVDEGNEIEEVILPPLTTFLEREHYSAVAQMLNGMHERYEHYLSATVLEETRAFLDKVKDLRSNHIERFNKVIGNNEFAFLRPLRYSRLPHPSSDVLRNLHPEHNAVAEQHWKRAWGNHYASGEVLKIKRLDMINYGYASATYAVKRIFPYTLDPDDRQSRTLDQDGALKVFVVKRNRIEVDLVEELLLHQTRAWRFFPPERAEQLAETEGLLIPVSLLKLVNDDDEETGQKEDRINELLGPKGDILNAFLLYPRAYACSLKFFLISWGRTDLLIKTAPMKAMISISIQMVYAVASLNSYGLVHGHIRPSSFVMTTDGKVLLTDFHTVVEEGSKLSCSHKRVRAMADLNASPEELECSHHGPGQTFEASFALDAWRLGVSLYKLWCRESWREPKPGETWTERLTTRQVAFVKAQQRGRTSRSGLDLQHCRADTPSFILRLIQQFLEPNPETRLTPIDAVKGTSLFRHMERRLKVVQDIRETMLRKRSEEL